MKKIIIFKTDRIGDFVNFSPCLKILKKNKTDTEITLICSKYNYQIVKNYKEIDKIFILQKNLLLDFFIILKNFFTLNYDYLFQFDGNKRSYILSCLIRANVKSTIFFFKNIKFFKIIFKIIRPNFILRMFFKNHIFCNEDYNINNEDTHYQTLYFRLLSNLGYEINYKQNIFYLDDEFKDIFNLINSKINNKYYLFHIDEKSNNLNSKQFNSLMDLISVIKNKYNVVLTLGIGDLKHLNQIKNKFQILDYKIDNIEHSQVICLKNIPLNLLSYLIANAEANLSMHSGSVVHISAAFNKLIVDIIESHKFNELDRWIPLISNYKRFDLNNLNNFNI